MEALFLKLVNMSISASWLVLAVVVLRLVMKKAPKWMTCALWALVAIRLVFPFSIESAFSLVPEPDPIPPSVITNHTPIVAPIDTPVSSDTPVISPGTPMLGTQADAVTPASITELAATVWVVGMAILLVYALVSYLLIRRKVAASLHLRENIYLCDYIESPFILGILQPRIYLPSSLAQSQWPHVLAHEQAHLHRKDHWWKPLGFAILCVYWFNPVLWLAYILLCRDIELACDERVIRDMDTRQKQDYTTALLECSMPRYLVAACPLAFGEVGVKERVKSVLNYKKPAFWIILIALILCVAAAVCFMTDPVGSNNITPGVYNVDSTLYQEDLRYDGVPQPLIGPGPYILHNNNLYWDYGATIIALGEMTPYDLNNRELNAYLQVDQWWKTFFHHIPTISDALWLQRDDGSFFLWFQTNNGETYLAHGVEDYGERYDSWEDETYITQLCRLTRDETAEEKELAWFDATVLDAQATWLMVSPIENTWMSSQYTQISVSRYWHAIDDGVAATGILPGEFTVGDRVRIVYDGNIAESSPAQITKTYSITKLAEQDTPSVDDITPFHAGLQFAATVLEVNDGSILVEPLVGAAGYPGIDHIRVSRKLADSGETVQGLAVGDTVLINYSGSVAESYPGQITNVFAIRKLPPMEPLRLYDSIEEAILDGCVAIVNGDAVAGQEKWDAFFQKSQAGQNTSVRYVTYQTIVSFEGSSDTLKRYPTLEVHDLTFDGAEYILRSVDSNGPTYIFTCPYLLHFTQPDGSDQRDYYYLTDRLDLTLETINAYKAFSYRHFYAHATYHDCVYASEPNMAELEIAKAALEPYMIEYKINYLDANELTHRLDVGISEWVDGLRDLIEQFIDWEFVTVTYQEEGSFVFVDRNELRARYPEFFGLPTFKGLELYAFEDGYALMTGTNREKTEDEINGLPRATAEEMKQILESYLPGPGGMIALDEIFVHNHTSRTEREIRKELGILPTAYDAVYISNATATEGLAEWYLTVYPGCEIWTGYDYSLEVYTDGSWVHYGYPTEELAWPSALRFHYKNTGNEPIYATEIFDIQWSTTTGGPLPPGQYRYRTGLTVYCDGEYSSTSCDGYFDIPETTPEDPGIHMEILNPTDTGATLAVTYTGGLMGELTTQGQYYLMTEVNGGCTTYGSVASRVPWDDVLYSLKEGETVYLDVSWDYTAEAPLPIGIYQVILTVDQVVPGSVNVRGGMNQDYRTTKYVTGTFAITD